MFDKQRLDGAVSPVVGVILMVAVTVILAAVIGSFVLDMGSNVEQNPSAGVTFDESDGEVTVTAISMENADGLHIQAGDSYYDPGTDAFDSATKPDDYAIDGVGQSITDDHGGDDITVTGTLNGNEAVIQTYSP